MNTLEVVDAYLASRRALGVRLERCGRLLHQFVREISNAALADIGSNLIDQFLRGRALGASWITKYHALVGLYRFAIARGYVAVSPLPTHRPKLPPQQTPYIYSNAELQRLVDATAVLYSRRSTSQAATYRTLLLLLYGTGMRVSEALGLQLSDVDLQPRIITVRNTKFYKTRLVPVGPRLTKELAAHLDRRCMLAIPEGGASGRRVDTKTARNPSRGRGSCAHTAPIASRRSCNDLTKPGFTLHITKFTPIRPYSGSSVKYAG